MAVGKKVISAFSGPADVNSFDMVTHVPSSKTIKSKKSPERKELEVMYQIIRDIREGKDHNTSIENVFAKLRQNHPNDWLLSVEIAEILGKGGKDELLQEVLTHLDNLKKKRPEIAHLIDGGLELIFEKEKIS
jgi:phenylalanine-4-hydroxylase